MTRAVDMRGGDACTGDYNQYRCMFAIGRDRVPAAEALPTEDAAIAGAENLIQGPLVAEYPSSGRAN